MALSPGAFEARPTTPASKIPSQHPIYADMGGRRHLFLANRAFAVV
jgi:hypothetical protein